jgi:O-antigen ligase
VAAAVSWAATTVVSAGSVRLPANFAMVQAGQFAIFALTAAAFLLTANHPLPEGTLRLWVMFIIAAGFGIMAFQAALGWKRNVAGWSGVLYVWPVVLLTSQLLFNRTLSRWQKVFGLCALVLWMYWSITVTIGWKSAWVPSLLGILLLLLLKSWRWFLVAIVLIGGAVVTLGPSNVADALLATEQSSATPVRWNLWFDVFRLGGKSPVIGLGPAAYTYYWRDSSFESWSHRYVDPYAFSRDVYAPPAHNMYADIFAQTGAVGLILLLGVVAGGLVLGVRAARRSLTPFGQAYSRGVLCGFAALAIASFFFAEWLLPYVYNLGLRGFTNAVYSWLLLGTLVWLGRADDGGIAPLG